MEDLRLELPAMIDAHDEGAIAATVEIVAVRNSIRSSRSSATRAPARSEEISAVPGELYLRITKPASINGLRSDIPPNAFAARAMRPVPFRTFLARKD